MCGISFIFFSVYPSSTKINGILALYADCESTSLSPIIILLLMSPPIISITFVKCLGSGLLKSKVSHPAIYSKYCDRLIFLSRSTASLSCLFVQTAIKICFDFAQSRNLTTPLIGLLPLSIFFA